MRPAVVTARCAKRRCLGIPFAWLQLASVSSGAGTIRAGMGDALDQRVRSNSGIKDLFGFVGCLSANARVGGLVDRRKLVPTLRLRADGRIVLAQAVGCARSPGLAYWSFVRTQPVPGSNSVICDAIAWVSRPRLRS